MASVPVLSAREREFLAAARTATLATVDANGRPRLVPICFVLGAADPPVVYTPLDEKPKSVSDPHELERVRDIVARPEVGLLVDRWSEDWARLGWLRFDGRADLMEPGAADPAEHRNAVTALRAKYPQYASHDLERRPIIRIAVERARSWGDLGDQSGSRPDANSMDSEHTRADETDLAPPTREPVR
jgi:PPOX class probable F420-dependent enzyme